MKIQKVKILFPVLFCLSILFLFSCEKEAVEMNTTRSDKELINALKEDRDFQNIFRNLNEFQSTLVDKAKELSIGELEKITTTTSLEELSKRLGAIEKYQVVAMNNHELAVILANNYPELASKSKDELQLILGASTSTNVNLWNDFSSNQRLGISCQDQYLISAAIALENRYQAENACINSNGVPDAFCMLQASNSYNAEMNQAALSYNVCALTTIGTGN